MYIKKMLVLFALLATTSGAFAASSDVDGAVRDLKSPSAHVRQSAVMTLGSSGVSQVGTHLFNTLNDNDPSVRISAIWALGQLKTPGAASRLIPLTYSSQRDIQRAAAGALGNIGDQSAAPALLNLTYSTDPSVQKASINALSQLKYAGAGARLTALLNSSDADVRTAAAMALNNIDYKAPSSIVYGSFIDGDSRVRASAVSLAGGDGRTDITPYLNLLKDPDPAVRSNAAVSISKTRNPEGVDFLRPLLNDPVQKVSLSAAEAMGAMGEVGVKALVSAMSSSSPAVRKNIVKGLVVAGQIAVPHIIPLLDSEPLCLDAISALSEIRSPLAADPLIKLFNSSNIKFQDAAAVAVGRIGVPVLPKLSELVKSKKATERRNAAKSLGEIRDKKSIEILMTLLKDLDESVVITTSVSFAKLGEFARPALINALNSDDDMQRAGAINAIALMGKSSLPFLVEKLNDRSPVVRAGAAMGIGQMDSVESLPLIRTLMENDMDPAVKKAAAWTMAKIGNKSLIPMLVVEKTRAAGKKQQDLLKTIERTISILESK